MWRQNHIITAEILSGHIVSEIDIILSETIAYAINLLLGDDCNN